MEERKRRKKEKDAQTERVWSYLTTEEKRRFKVRLAAVDIQMSAWIRNMILQFLETPMPEGLFN